MCKTAGIWVSGCFYNDETGKEQILQVGQSQYVGIVGHNCKEISSNPGRIQYWISFNPNVTIASPSDRGRNALLPYNVTHVPLIQNVTVLPTLYNAEYFIAANVYNVKIRYLVP